jgi:UDP-glucose 4-epimerase
MIIVTGATGFVGRYLTDHLVKAGEKVVAAGRTRKYDEFFRNLGVPFVPLDVTQPESFKALPPGPVKAFIHLAAAIPAAVKDIKSDIFLKVNALGTFYALEHCRRNNIKKFLYTTTLYEGMEHTQLPINEAMGRKYALTGDHASYVISNITRRNMECKASSYGLPGCSGSGDRKASGPTGYSTKVLLRCSMSRPRLVARWRYGGRIKPNETRCTSRTRCGRYIWPSPAIAPADCT